MIRRSILRFIDRNYKHKPVLAVLAEIFIFTAILFASYWIRLGSFTEGYVPQIFFILSIYLPLKLFVFWAFRLYRVSFRYFSLYDLLEVLKAAAVSAAFLSFIGLVFRDYTVMKGYPRSVVFIDFLLTFLASTGLRFGYRIFYTANYGYHGGMRVLIVGAGDAGVRLIKEMMTTSRESSSYIPVAFIDDDPAKLGSIIRGIRVAGNRTDIPSLVKELEIEGVIISIPSATASEISGIVEYARQAGVEHIKIVPRISDVLTGKVTIGDFKEASAGEFLGRDSVRVESAGIASYIKGKRVMVTGAGGSIGSELCRQISSFEPGLLIMLDVGDTELFYINNEVRDRSRSVPAVPVIADVKDMVAMKDVFDTHSPEVVFHAAAYKHVPLLESSPREAVLNNIEGTKVTALLSSAFGVRKFVFISTDKAVNPTSVMGATKRVSENMLREINGGTEFVSVRFGNVLDSRGSVIPIFRDQVRRGGPVTVTHPDMTRYFMSIHEAVFLVLQAGALGKGGEVFVLDMGEPVRILDLAHNIIRFYGLEPDKDVPIVYTGLRPGEKLFEEILTAEEGTTVTVSKKIYIANDRNHFGREYIEDVRKLINMAERGAPRDVLIYMLKELVPTYQAEIPDLGNKPLKSSAAR